MFFKLKKDCSAEKNNKMKEEFKKGMEGGLVIIPNDIEVIRFNNYEVWSKGDYIKHMLSGGAITKSKIEEHWKHISKGYNFVIAMYIEERKDYDMYSVEYFNELMK